MLGTGVVAVALADVMPSVWGIDATLAARVPAGSGRPAGAAALSGDPCVAACGPVDPTGWSSNGRAGGTATLAAASGFVGPGSPGLRIDPVTSSLSITTPPGTGTSGRPRFGSESGAAVEASAVADGASAACCPYAFQAAVVPSSASTSRTDPARMNSVRMLSPVQAEARG